MAMLKFGNMLNVNMDQVKSKRMCKRLEPSHLAKYIILSKKRTHSMVIRATTTKIRLCHSMVVRATNKLMIWYLEHQVNSSYGVQRNKKTHVLVSPTLKM